MRELEGREQLFCISGMWFQLAKSSTCLGNHTGREIQQSRLCFFLGLRTEHKPPEVLLDTDVMGEISWKIVLDFVVIKVAILFLKQELGICDNVTYSYCPMYFLKP